MSELKRGNEVVGQFTTLDATGKADGCMPIRGVFLEYRGGRARVCYRTALLPARCVQDPAAEFNIVDHEVEPVRLLPV